MYLLHGWSINSNNQEKWQHFIQVLTQTGIKSQFLALPGLSTPLTKPWGLTDYEQWLEQQLKEQKKVDLLGHSFGGQLAIRYAAHHPEQIQHLILIDAAGIRDKAWHLVLKRHLFAQLAKIGKKITNSDLAKKILYKLAHEQDYFTAPPVMKQTMVRVLNEEITTDLAKITCPTLIIWGQADRITPLKLGKKIKQGITNSQLTIINQACHSPQFTHSQQTATLIKQFLDQNL